MTPTEALAVITKALEENVELKAEVERLEEAIAITRDGAIGVVEAEHKRIDEVVAFLLDECRCPDAQGFEGPDTYPPCGECLWCRLALKSGRAELLRMFCEAARVVAEENAGPKDAVRQKYGHSVSVELHCGRWALMVNGHGIVIEGDICRSEHFSSKQRWTKALLEEVVMGLQP